MHLAAMVLGRKPRMKGQALRSGRFGGIEELQHQHHVRTRTRTRLERDRHAVGLGNHRGKKIMHQLGVLDERRSGAFAHYSWHWASCIEIDLDEPAERRHLACRECELVGFGPEELTRHRTLTRQHFHEMPGRR